MKPAIALFMSVIILCCVAACGRRVDPISPSQAKQEQQRKLEKQSRGPF